MSTLLIVAEHDGQTLNPSIAKTLSCARAIEGVETIDVFVAGQSCDDIAAAAAQLDGVARVRVADRADNAAPLAAVLAPQVADIATDYDYVFGPSTTFGKDLMPRIAALLETGQVSDIMSVEDPRTFKRPTYAGNAIVTVRVPDDQKVIATVRVASWPAAGDGGSAEIEPIGGDVEIPSGTRFIELQSGGGDRPDLQSAKVVLSGGRGVGSGDNFDILYALADKIGAAVGASRAAVDAGYVPNDMQVGQTGKIIAPDLYIAFGISGAIQHLTGIKDAGTIVAVNKDPEAPIFDIADIGLVADLFDVIPALNEKLGG